jgi:hypothetical protein
MERVLLFTVLAILTISCSKDNADPDPEVIGQWKLIEIYADPGDGSGTFQPVESGKMVTFRKDGTVSSNGSICMLSTESNNPTSGTFSLLESTITSPECVGGPELNIHFELINSKLIMRYPCFEACEEKYVKID